MGRKTIKQSLDDKESGLMTVGELVKELQQFPQDTPVGTVYDFGEFEAYDGLDFNVRKAYIAVGFGSNQKRRELTTVCGPDRREYNNCNCDCC